MKRLSKKQFAFLPALLALVMVLLLGACSWFAKAEPGGAVDESPAWSAAPKTTAEPDVVTEEETEPEAENLPEIETEPIVSAAGENVTTFQEAPAQAETSAGQAQGENTGGTAAPTVSESNNIIGENDGMFEPEEETGEWSPSVR